MQEILKSIKAFLYDRTVSPLTGAFVTAWLVWNYRVIFYLLDGKALVTEKIAYLDTYFGDDHLFQLLGYTFHVFGGGHLVNGLLMPSVLTWVYLYVYPQIAIPVYIHSLIKQKDLRNAKQLALNERLLTVEESRNIQKEIEQLRYKADEESDKSAKRIAILVENINKLESQQNIDKNNIQISNNKNESFSRDELNRSASEKISLINLKKQAQFQSHIFEKFPLIKFKKESFVSDDKRTEELEIISNYFFDKKIGEDGFDLIFELVMNDGTIYKRSGDETSFVKNLSSIELDHLISNLEKERYIIDDNISSRITLVEAGKNLAVSSGLAALVKKIAR